MFQEVAVLLVDGGANVHQPKNITQETPLLIASKNGHREIVRHLISLGAHVNVKDTGGVVALHWASFFGHVQIVESLIFGGADPNITTNKGGSSLYFAAENGHLVRSLTFLLN